ncbi:MAG: Hsp20/alpha crystallin family protein [Candidatus Promineifilaceae bacterium]
MLVKRTYRPSYPELGWVTKEMNRLNRDFNRSFWAAPASTSGFNWTVSEDSVVISAELPGFSSDNINISLEKNVVTIAGERPANDYGEDATILRRERRAGKFTRSFKLPFAIDADSVSADFTNGILMVTLPRTAADKPRQIEVKAA